MQLVRHVPELSSHGPALALGLLAGALLLPVAAGAQQDDQAAPGPVVEELTLVGVDRLNAGDIKKVLATRTSSWLPWAEPRYLDREELQRDLMRVVAYYRDHGFPQAQVVSHDVRLSDQGTKAAVTIRVQEGQPLIVRDIELAGFDPLSASRLETLRGQVPVVVGDPVVYQQVLAGGELAAGALKDRGYAHAEVRVLERREDGEVVVRYVAEPGRPAYFGEIEVVGNASVDDQVIRRKLTFQPGERFSRERVMESQRALYGLQLFRFANIEVLDGDEQSSRVPIRVTVAEGKHRRVQFSAGYGTEEKLRGEARWEHANFYGGARTLGVQGRWSALNRGGQVDFVQPYLFNPRLSLSLDGHSWYSDEPAFTVLAQGGRASVNGLLNPRTSWAGVLTAEHQRSRIAEAGLNDPSFRDDLIALGLNPETGEQDGLLVSLGGRFQRNTTTSPLDPQEGYLLSMQLEQAGAWLPGSYHFVNGLLEGRLYRRLGERIVVAGRLRAAAIDPFGPTSDVPFFKRYFLGGATSLRGWGRFEVAPLSPAGLPVGGHSMFESSLEVRARVVGNFGLITFVDAGNVWADEWDFRLHDLLYDVGAGLRYYTPIGPVRLDLAWQLTPIDGLLIDGQPQDRRWRLHASIGQAF